MAEYQPDKFIVINRKHLRKLFGKNGRTGLEFKFNELKQFEKALESVTEAIKAVTGKSLNQKYYVCNQDEPYSQKVLDVILKGEAEKEK